MQNTRPLKIVLTGASLSSKTTMIRRFQEMGFEHVMFVPEVATQILPIVYKDLVSKVDPSLWQPQLQNSIYNIHVDVEDAIESSSQFLRAIIFDRGCIDGSAYYYAGKEAWENLVGEKVEELYSRYDYVFFLTSIANDGDLYDVYKSNNPSRIHSKTETLVAEKQLYEVWKNHPNFVLIPLQDSEHELFKFMNNKLKHLLRTEQERKYYFPNKSANELLNYFNVDCFNSDQIAQTYLSEDPEIRVRWSVNEGYTFTIKEGQLPRRIEASYLIPEEMGHNILSDLKCLEKKRDSFSFNGYHIDIDTIEKVDGVLLEVEYIGENDPVIDFLPSGAVDVTNDPNFKSVNLWKKYGN